MAVQIDMSALRTAEFWFVVLAAVACAAPHLTGRHLTSWRDRRAVAITIAFLAWILLLMTSVRSR